MSIRDDGPGVPPTEVEHVYFAERQGVHALVLLRRRLQGLFGRSFRRHGDYAHSLAKAVRSWPGIAETFPSEHLPFYWDTDNGS